MCVGPKIRGSVLQLQSRNGKIAENLAHAEPFVDQAATQGAQIILLPEFYATGFEINSNIWLAGESSQGTTVQWLAHQARKHSLFIGTSFLEACNGHFYNTFVLLDPSGGEVARLRKSKPAATESYYFRGEKGPRVFETTLGRIGISICYEAALTSTMQQLLDEKADLLLMPMSAPVPTLNAPVTEQDLEEYREAIRDYPQIISQELGIAVMMANKVGPWVTQSPWPFPDESSRFPGFSACVDANGCVVDRLEDQEGALVTDLDLDSRRRSKQFTPASGKWARRPPKLFKLFKFAEILGQIHYCGSIKRRRMATRYALE